MKPKFRTLLRQWRSRRSLSQLALAELAGISTRHLSFLETGRSHPSRGMVLRLSDRLELSATDENLLLLSANYAPNVAADDAETMTSDGDTRMLDAILSQQRSVPTLVIDESWTIRKRNEIAAKVFADFRPSYRLPESVSDNALHILCHPDGLRQFMPNWASYAAPFVRQVDREASAGTHAAAAQLREALFCYPGVSEAANLADDGAEVPLTLQLKRNRTSLAFYTAFSAIELPAGQRPKRVKIEYLYPADGATSQIIADLSGGAA